jgi:acetyltransferase-like isoleucine patch superfamily enzyme
MKKLYRFLYSSLNNLNEKFVKLKTLFIYKYLIGKMGKNCIIFKPIRFIGINNVYISDNVRIYKNSRIETIENWGKVKYNPSIHIGNGTTFEQNLHLTCASKVKIGNYVTVLANVMITDINHSYKDLNSNIIKQPIEVKNTIIGDYCFIGMGARIMPGTVLGKNCIVGTNSVVSGIFDDYSVIVGAPAKIVKRYDFDNSRWRKIDDKGDFLDEI